MNEKIHLFPWLEKLISSGSRPDFDVHKIRLIRQVNGLSLFFTLVAATVSFIFLVIMKPSAVLTGIQIFAMFLYLLCFILNRSGKLVYASNLVIYAFEIHIFGIMLLTNAWNSPALGLIVLYPLLAALVEVSIFRHLGVGLLQGFALMVIHYAFPAAEWNLQMISSINADGEAVLHGMGVFYPPVMAAVIIAIIFNENILAREKQKIMMGKITDANKKLEHYANQLKDETQRLKAEVSVAKKIQTMVLPRAGDMESIEGLDIACIMRTADEVGGDYYDIINTRGKNTIAIGDVTGHGLSSGLIMLMAQTAVRTLAEMKVENPRDYLPVINRVLYANIMRIREDRSMTLAVISYEKGRCSLAGQHESVVICRKNGAIEVLDTIDNGFYVGMTLEGAADFKTNDFSLSEGDVMLLYSDGVTEAENEQKEQFGLRRLCNILKKYRDGSAEEIKSGIMKDLYNFMGNRGILDDISLVVARQK